MTAIVPESTVGLLVAQNPSRASVFEKHRIDFCCQGKTSLAEACAKREVSLHAVLGELLECDRGTPVTGDRDWTGEPLSDLADHIVDAHHRYLRGELPRIQAMSKRVADVHGGHAPEVLEVLRIFSSLHSEMDDHMMKEEQVLFPAIRAMEASGHNAFGGAMIAPIRCMEHEHESAGAALASMRSLTDGFEPPADACNTWRVLYAALAGLESDMHIHVHKENSILFPRALALEDRLRSTAAGAR